MGVRCCPDGPGVFIPVPRGGRAESAHGAATRPWRGRWCAVGYTNIKGTRWRARLASGWMGLNLPRPWRDQCPRRRVGPRSPPDPPLSEITPLATILWPRFSRGFLLCGEHHSIAGLGDADRQTPRDEKGDRGAGAPAGAYGLTAPNSAGPGNKRQQQHEKPCRFKSDRRKLEFHQAVERCPSRDDG